MWAFNVPTGVWRFVCLYAWSWLLVSALAEQNACIATVCRNLAWWMALIDSLHNAPVIACKWKTHIKWKKDYYIKTENILSFIFNIRYLYWPSSWLHYSSHQRLSMLLFRLSRLKVGDLLLLYSVYRLTHAGFSQMYIKSTKWRNRLL